MILYNKYINIDKLIAFILLLILQNGYSQHLPLGTWTAHLPLQNAVSICQSKDYVYAGCENGVIGINIDNNLIEKYTKVSGLAEVFVAQVGYDTATSTLVIAYTNSNIDLIKNDTQNLYIKCFYTCNVDGTIRWVWAANNVKPDFTRSQNRQIYNLIEANAALEQNTKNDEALYHEFNAGLGRRGRSVNGCLRS